MTALPEGFVPHGGGPCPYDSGGVDVMLANGICGLVSTINRQWEWLEPMGNSIIAYRLKEPTHD